MKRKSRKKQQFEAFGNCLNEPEGMPGHWRALIGQPGPLVVELAAGRCDWALGYAEAQPAANLVAVDVKSERLWAGGRRALERELPNVRFLRTDITQLARYFAPGEIDRLWLTFPDPYPKRRHAKHRLTHPAFLARYRPLLAPGAPVFLKTDSDELYAYTLRILRNLPFARLHAYTPDLYRSAHANAETQLETYYEAKWRAETSRLIKLICFSLSEPPPGTSPLS